MATFDILAKISGTKPRVLMSDGDEIRMSSYTTDLVWNIKRISNHYTCSCPGWNQQMNTPDQARTCRHLENLLGQKYEVARLARVQALAQAADASKSTSLHKHKKKPFFSSSEEDDVDDSPKVARKRARAISISSSTSDNDNDDDNNSKPPSKRSQAKPSSSRKDTPNKRAKRNGGDAPNSHRSTDSAPSSINISVLLAKAYKESMDPTGWWISEKMDGVRAYFCKGAFYSRLGNKFFAPDSFTAEWRDRLPDGATLDGELFTGRSKFQSTVSIVRSSASDRWGEVTYQVFDAPFLGNKPFEERLAFLTKLFGEPDQPKYKNVSVVGHEKCKGRQHLMDMLDELQNKGAEGLMLREPGSKYEARRSPTLLKLKTFYDAEARVIGHHKGTGKNAHVCGAIEVEMACGTKFKIGSGFSDAQRKKPPKKGEIVVYRFQELSRSGIPRFPIFVGVSADKTVPKDAVVRSVDGDDGDDD